MASQYQMVMQSLMEGLRRCNYDVTRLEPVLPKRSLFTDPVIMDSVYGGANLITEMLQFHNENGGKYSEEELLNEIEERTADWAFFRALSNIRMCLRFGDNVSKYVQEAQEALAVLRSHKLESLEVRESLFAKSATNRTVIPEQIAQ